MTGSTEGDQVIKIIGQKIIFVFVRNVFKTFEWNNMMYIKRAAMFLLEYTASLTAIVISFPCGPFLLISVRAVIPGGPALPVVIFFASHADGQPFGFALKITKVMLHLADLVGLPCELFAARMALHCYRNRRLVYVMAFTAAKMVDMISYVMRWALYGFAACLALHGFAFVPGGIRASERFKVFPKTSLVAKMPVASFDLIRVTKNIGTAIKALHKDRIFAHKEPPVGQRMHLLRAHRYQQEAI